MDVHIEEVVASVTAVDSNAVLSPRILGTIVEAVLAAQADAERHRQRRTAESAIGSSVRDSTGGV